MFVAALFIIVKIWRLPGCLSMDKWIKKSWPIHRMEYYSAIKKNEILPSETSWMGPEGIVLRGVGRTEKDKCHMISLTCGI